MKKKGFPILKEKGYYKFDFSKWDQEILLPMEMSSESPWLRLKSHEGAFDKQTVQEMFGVGSTQAGERIRTWLEEGHIEEVKSGGKKKTYKLKDCWQ